MSPHVSFGFKLVDRAAIMQSGSVVYEGPIDGLDTARVARLLGVGRLLGAHLERAVKGRERRRPPGKRATARRKR
jgi:hypothetical protein